MKKEGLEDWKAGKLLFAYSPFAVRHLPSAICYSPFADSLIHLESLI
jgi:hypothetical protein